MFVDIWLLSDNLSVTDQDRLRNMESGQANIFFKSDLIEQGLEELVSGFARIFIYGNTYGVEIIKEGHFKAGVQDGFGRYHYYERTMNLTGSPMTENHFVGWFPEADKKGVGIIMQGTFNF